MKRVVEGMVGVGNFGAHRREQMRASGCFQIAAVCDRSQELLAAAAAAEGSAKAYTDFAQMLWQGMRI